MQGMNLETTLLFLFSSLLLNSLWNNWGQSWFFAESILSKSSAALWALYDIYSASDI